MEAWAVARTEMIIILLLLFSGVIGGWIWGRHSVRAPFRERRITRRTLIQRLKWSWSHRIRPNLMRA